LLHNACYLIIHQRNELKNHCKNSKQIFLDVYFYQLKESEGKELQN
jgi:hypothetical protein